MTIYFISRQPEICHIIAHQLQDHICYVFSDMNLFIETLRKLNTMPDLIVADYQLYNHELINPFTYIDEKRLHFGLIFYNDPCLFNSDRAKHWYLMMKTLKREFSLLDPDRYVDVLERIARIIEDPKLRPYINLMQPAKPLPPDYVVTHMYRPTDAEELYSILIKVKQRINLSDNLFYLLDVLYRYMERFSTLEEIQQAYLADGKEIKISSLKVEMSRLKTAIEGDRESKYTIIRKKNSYRLYYSG